MSMQYLSIGKVVGDALNNSIILILNKSQDSHTNTFYNCYGIKTHTNNFNLYFYDIFLLA